MLKMLFRRLLLLSIFSVCVVDAEDLVVKDDTGGYRRYEEYRVIRVYSDGIEISHLYGIARIPLNRLPEHIAKRYADEVALRREVNSDKAKERTRAARHGVILKKESSKSPNIVVQVIGKGISEAEALEDAFRIAVRKAVGMYVVTQSKLKDDDFEESVYINSDAVITGHKILKTTKEDGLVVLELTATVERNQLLKHVSKKESAEVSSTERANLLNRRKALAVAEKSLEYIFKDFSRNLFLGRRIGTFSIADTDEVGSSTARVEMTYELEFNKDEYRKIKKRLYNLLGKVAVARKTGATRDLDSIFNRGRDSVIARFNQCDASKTWATGTKTIAFVDADFFRGKIFRYRFYAVPNQIYEKMARLLSDTGVIVFDFQLSGCQKPLKHYHPAEISFFRRGEFGNRKTLFFHNGMFINVPDYGRRYVVKESFKKTFSCTEDQLRAMKSCRVAIYTGQQAQFVLKQRDR